MNKSILFHEERPPPVAAVTVLLHNEKESFPQGRGKAPRFTSSSLSPVVRSFYFSASILFRYSFESDPLS